MENSPMRITFVALLIGSIWIMQSSLRAQQTIVAVNTNFEPAKDSDLSQPTNPPPPQAAQPAQAPVPALHNRQPLILPPAPSSSRPLRKRLYTARKRGMPAQQLRRKA